MFKRIWRSMKQRPRMMRRLVALALLLALVLYFIVPNTVYRGGFDIKYNNRHPLLTVMSFLDFDDDWHRPRHVVAEFFKAVDAQDYEGGKKYWTSNYHILGERFEWREDHHMEIMSRYLYVDEVLLHAPGIGKSGYRHVSVTTRRKGHLDGRAGFFVKKINGKWKIVAG